MLTTSHTYIHTQIYDVFNGNLFNSFSYLVNTNWSKVFYFIFVPLLGYLSRKTKSKLSF